MVTQTEINIVDLIRQEQGMGIPESNSVRLEKEVAGLHRDVRNLEKQVSKTALTVVLRIDELSNKLKLRVNALENLAQRIEKLEDELGIMDPSFNYGGTTDE
jgi:hypothetical protein